MKKDIVVNFSKQERFITLKSNQKSEKSTKRFGKKSAGLAKSAVKSTDMKKGFARAN